jgi:hypothetical protein
LFLTGESEELAAAPLPPAAEDGQHLSEDGQGIGEEMGGGNEGE